MAKQASAKESNADRKKRLLALARNLFWQRGYHAVSMRDLARAYGCQPANLYNFFETKEAILFEVLLEEMEEIIHPISHLEDEEDGDPVEQLRFMISVHLKVTLGHRRSAKSLHEVALDNLSSANRDVIVSLRDTYDRIMRRVIRRGQNRGHFLPCNEKLVSFMVSSMITRSRIWFHPDQGVTMDELADFIFRFVLRAIQATDGFAGDGKSSVSSQAEQDQAR